MKNINSDNLIHPYFSMFTTNSILGENNSYPRSQNSYLGQTLQNPIKNQLIFAPESINYLTTSNLLKLNQTPEETSKTTDRETFEKSEKNSILEKTENRELSFDNFNFQHSNNNVFDLSKNINNYGSNYVNIASSKNNIDLANKLIQESNNLNNNVAFINEYFHNALMNISSSNTISNVNFFNNFNNLNNLNNNYNLSFFKNNIANLHNLNLLYNLNNLNNNLNNMNTISETEKSEEKNFICLSEGCGKKFDYKWIMEKHLTLYHSGLKSFKCIADNCNKSYKSRENLNLHVKNKHLGVKPYTCKFCNSKFSHRNGKTYHERKVHLKFLPFKCVFENCNLSFASKSALKYHTSHQH